MLLRSFSLFCIHFGYFQLLFYKSLRHLFAKHNSTSLCILKIFLASISQWLPVRIFNKLNKFSLILNTKFLKYSSKTLFLRYDRPINPTNNFNFNFFQPIFINIFPIIQQLFNTVLKYFISLTRIRIHIRI